MSVFAGNAGNGLRLRYAEITLAQINLTSTKANAHMLVKFDRECRVILMDNPFDVELGVAFVHPSKDPEVDANRLLAFEMPAARPINFDTTGLSYDAGMWIYIWKLAGTATSGTKFRLIYWG